MNIESLYRTIAEMIALKNFDAIRSLTIEKPEKFNWVKEVFENIYTKDDPGANALIWTDGQLTRSFSYHQLCAQNNRFLNYLRKQGVQQGDVIYAQMPLLPENWLTVLVSIKGGFRLIPAATILSIHDIVYRFGKLMPAVVVADTGNAIKIDQAEELSGNAVQLKILVNGARPGWRSFDEIEQESGLADAAATNADDPLFLFFTSGTTGMPKVVKHTHYSYPFGHLTTASWIGLAKGDIHYDIAQPGWAKFAWSSFFAPWGVGATVFAFYQTTRFIAAEHLKLMETYGITTFCAPPTALRMLILEDLKAYTFSLRQCVAAGEPLNPEIVAAWKKETGILLRDGYGQTESTCLVANLPGEKLKYGSMGKPTFLYDVVIADEQGNCLPTNEEGNIAVKTNHANPNGLFAGYFGDEAKLKEVFRHDLYYTGDKAYIDDEGYIWFVGRDDDVIKSSDYRIGPFEVESVLLEHESVIESAAVASPDAKKGFVVKAFVVLNEGYSAGREMADEIFAFAKKNIAPYKMPRIIEFVEQLPKTISGKIRRVELRANEAGNKMDNIQSALEFYYNA